MNYIFGYGSLIFADGINNGRGMKRFYTEDDLIEPRTLIGYRREWNAVFNNVKFLGLVPDPNGKVNGVLFPISDEDLEPFKESEGIGEKYNPPMYTLVDVTDQVDADFRHRPHIRVRDGHIWTCVTYRPNYSGQVLQYYMETLDRGFTIRGRQFKNDFYRLTFSNPKDTKC